MLPFDSPHLLVNEENLEKENYFSLLDQVHAKCCDILTKSATVDASQLFNPLNQNL